MLTFAYYLLKVIVCSGVLFGYYYSVLRNKRFHQYNRFYLLFVLIISWVIPIAKIQIWNEANQNEPVAVKLLTVVAASDAFVEESAKSSAINWSAEYVGVLCFLLVSTVFFVRLLLGLLKMRRLISTSPTKRWNNINFIFTTAKGAPFSFFKYIFWNQNIDVETTEGKHILQHELTHVTEKHSIDKLFVNILLIAGWANPFNWFIKKELEIIHEFIADKKAINNGDISAFAAMLLQSTYPGHNFSLTNSFFHSPIKRRLLMLTNSKNPRYSYLRRLMILPITFIVVIFFAFKAKDGISKEDKSATTKIAHALLEVDITDTPTLPEKSLKKAASAKLPQTKTVGTENDSYTITASSIQIHRSDKDNLAKTLIVLNDKTLLSWEEFEGKNIKAEEIQKVNVLKGEDAKNKYGEKGVNGVVEIFTKSNFVDNAGTAQEIVVRGYETPRKPDTTKVSFNKIFTRVENPPYFSKGMVAFANFIEKNMQYPKDAIVNKVEGAVTIQFVVDENGKLNDFKKLSSKGFGLEEEAIRLLQQSGDWNPGVQNGHKVPVQISQQIIFNFPAKKVSGDENTITGIFRNK
jgi:TonB family protein